MKLNTIVETGFRKRLQRCVETTSTQSGKKTVEGFQPGYTSLDFLSLQDDFDL